MTTLLKVSLPLLFGLVLGAGLPACGSPSLNIKTWYLSEPQGGLIRKHDGAPTEVMTFLEAEGYRCVNQKDYDLLIYLAKQAGIKGVE